MGRCYLSTLPVEAFERQGLFHGGERLEVLRVSGDWFSTRLEIAAYATGVSLAVGATSVEGPFERCRATLPAMAKPVCVVVGIGPKNGASFVRRFHEGGYRVALLSRTTELSSALARELGNGGGDAKAYACDVADRDAVVRTFDAVRADLGDPEVLVYNAGSGTWKGFDATTPDDLERALRINAVGMMMASQAVLPAMRTAKKGCILVVGATASLRGKPMTTAFAAAKAAQRSLAQSMARQFWPEGVHVSLLIIDGAIGDAGAAGAADGDVVKRLDPRAIAETAFQLSQQAPSAWSFEVDLRPKDEPW
jgi:NAD(P)-dependent dehydrogenase (short-subunit alcohol dehydrogenase family)